MQYVYVLQSKIDSNRYYFGHNTDLKNRIASHNKGQSKHTSKYKPWNIIWYGGFASLVKARDFEKYLKTASGKAFLRKRLI